MLPGYRPASSVRRRSQPCGCLRLSAAEQRNLASRNSLRRIHAASSASRVGLGVISRRGEACARARATRSRSGGPPRSKSSEWLQAVEVSAGARSSANTATSYGRRAAHLASQIAPPSGAQPRDRMPLSLYRLARPSPGGLRVATTRAPPSGRTRRNCARAPAAGTAAGRQIALAQDHLNHPPSSELREDQSTQRRTPPRTLSAREAYRPSFSRSARAELRAAEDRCQRDGASDRLLGATIVPGGIVCSPSCSIGSAILRITSGTAGQGEASPLDAIEDSCPRRQHLLAQSRELVPVCAACLIDGPMPARSRRAVGEHRSTSSSRIFFSASGLLPRPLTRARHRVKCRRVPPASPRVPPPTDSRARPASTCALHVLDFDCR